MIIRARAPLRISFGGGGTDISPYPEIKGGVALNVAINKYAYVSLRPYHDKRLVVRSLDYSLLAKYHLDEKLVYDGELDLVKAVVNNLEIKKGVELFIQSEAPPGSGLGNSSSMMVALIGAFSHLLGKKMTDYEIAELAYFIERKSLGSKGGKQDQFAASFGGFNFMEFTEETTIVNPLRIKPAIFNELLYHLMLCFTGTMRKKIDLEQHQIKKTVREKIEQKNPLDALKDVTIEMKKVLLREQLDEFGALLHEAWLIKQQTHQGIRTAVVDELYSLARANGALGGKMCGAPGGGYFLLYCPFDKKHLIARKLEELGGQITPFNFELQGLQVWEVI